MGFSKMPLLLQYHCYTPLQGPTRATVCLCDTSSLGSLYRPILHTLLQWALSSVQIMPNQVLTLNLSRVLIGLQVKVRKSNITFWSSDVFLALPPTSISHLPYWPAMFALSEHTMEFPLSHFLCPFFVQRISPAYGLNPNATATSVLHSPPPSNIKCCYGLDLEHLPKPHMSQM